MTNSPKVEKLASLIEAQIKQRKALLKEGEELDYDKLEEELVNAVMKAMETPSKEEAEHPAMKQEVIEIPEQNKSTDEMGENSNKGYPTPFAPLPPDQQSKPNKPRIGVAGMVHQLLELKNAIHHSDSQYSDRKSELLEGLRTLRQDMVKARNDSTREFSDIYETCAKRFNIPMGENDDWKAKVNRHLKKSKLLK